ISEHFRENKKTWFDKTMSLYNISCVKSIEGDISKFDFRTISPIAFCLLDVDIYEPTRLALPVIYAAMSFGGIIVVDDCKPKDIWDGSLQAYEEFVQSRGLPRQIVSERLGIIRVDRRT